MAAPDDPLDRLHRDLGFRRLSWGWAKFEIVFGLVTVAGGLFGALRLAVAEARTGAGPDWVGWLATGGLFVFGAYLTLAGHRSHLYQSSNRLAAHLAELIRQNPNPPRGDS